MVCQTSINGRIITAGWHAKPTSMVTLSLSDHTPDQRQWPNHHRRMVHRTGVDGRIITAGWYTGSALMVKSS
jgi:alpha-D-ribose 1-methylphosphonate 5-triphosphate diphosphatase PhnM